MQKLRTLNLEPLWTPEDFIREYHLPEFIPAESAQQFGQLASALTRQQQ